MTSALTIRTSETEESTDSQRLAQDHTDSRRNQSKFVVVHSGARDAYQLAIALSEAGMLETLVTDLFWPMDRTWCRQLLRFLPGRMRTLVLQRSDSRLPAPEVRVCAWSGLKTLLLDKLSRVSPAIRRKVTRETDSRLGDTAGKQAQKTNSGLISYSYYAFDAFRAYSRPAILFQLHPHPASVRRILTEELQANPDCAASLTQEWELSLPEEDFQHLVRESTLASHILVASTFTKHTLVENGTAPDSITVTPYGVDTARFVPDARRRSSSRAKLELLFVGRINQRKGIKYLLEAIRMLDSRNVHVIVCGRVVDGLELFRSFAGQVEVRPSVSAAELVAAYQAADMFVFPSVAEGFGQVLLEALSCGLPILSTTNTAAPDLIEEGVQGFVIEPRRPDLIAERIDWALTHRDSLVEMGVQARRQAEQFTWQRFRARVVEAARTFSEVDDLSQAGRRPYV